MHSFEYDHTDYVQFVNDWARHLQVPVTDNGFALPAYVGEGRVEACNLPNGLSILMADLRLAERFYMVRKKIYEEYYVLKLDVLDIPSVLEFRIDERSTLEFAERKASVMLLSTLFEASFLLPAGFGQRSLYILFSREWLARYMHIADYEDVLQRYLMLKTSNINVEVMDAAYRSLMDEVLDAEPASRGYSARIEARVMMIVERFLESLKSKADSLQEWHIKKDDIKRVMLVEDTLARHYNTQPPTLEAIAKQASVSVSKLKRDFKEVFGLPPYEYYQKLRMHKARNLLMSGSYTVKEVGYALGYSNLSNFSYAFKKEFSVLPSEMII